jgi:hypothetical protein
MALLSYVIDLTYRSFKSVSSYKSVLLLKIRVIMLKKLDKYISTTSKTINFFTALNVLGLSIGIAGLIFATLYWNDEHSYDKWNLKG